MYLNLLQRINKLIKYFGFIKCIRKSWEYINIRGLSVVSPLQKKRNFSSNNKNKEKKRKKKKQSRNESWIPIGSEKNRPLKQWISRIPSILNPYNASSLFASPHSPTSSRAIKPSSAPKPGNGSTEVIATIVVVAVPTAKSHQPDQPNLTKYQQVANPHE